MIRDVKLNVNVIQPVNMFECEIGNNCLVAEFVEIQKNTVIGDGTRIQSHSFICGNVTVRKNCFIPHGVMFADDMFPSGRPAFLIKRSGKKLKLEIMFV